jgi:hypothetical protein
MFEQSSPGFNRIWIFRNLQWVLCLKQEKRFFIEAPFTVYMFHDGSVVTAAHREKRSQTPLKSTVTTISGNHILPLVSEIS